MRSIRNTFTSTARRGSESLSRRVSTKVSAIRMLGRVGKVHSGADVASDSIPEIGLELPGATPTVLFLAQYSTGLLDAEKAEAVWDSVDTDQKGHVKREAIKQFLADVRVMHLLMDRRDRAERGQIRASEIYVEDEVQRVADVPTDVLEFVMRQLGKHGDTSKVLKENFVRFFDGRPLAVGVEGVKRRSSLGRIVASQVADMAGDSHQSLLVATSPRRMMVDNIRNALILYNLIRVPFSCAFSPGSTPWLMADFVVDFFFLLHFLLSMVTVPAGTEINPEELMDQAVDWWSSAECWYQVVCGLPVDFVLYLSGSNYFQYWRVPRMLRFQDLRRSFKRWELNLHVSFVKVQIFKFVIALAVIAHIEACVWYGLARWQGFGLNTWYGVAQAADRIRSLEGRSDFAKYLRSLSSAGFAILEAGYAEVSPANNYELAFAISVGLLNMVLSSYLLGNIASLVTSSRARVAVYRDEMRNISEFAHHQKLPEALRDSLLHFKQAVFMEGLNDYEVMTDYPPNMQLEVARFSHMSVLRATELFKNCDSSFLDAILIELKPMVLLRGQHLVRRGTSAKEMYFLHRGTVDFIEARYGLAQQVDQQDAPVCVGDISFLFGTRANLDVVTVTDCHLLVLTRSAFNTITTSHSSQSDILRHNCLELYRSRISKQVMEEMEDTIERINQEKMMQLCDAASTGDVKTVAYVSDNGLNLGLADYDKRTALHISASENTVPVTEFLLQKGAPADPVDRWGNNPLHDATINGHDQVCKLLIDAGARLSATAETTMLVCAAAAAGQVDTVARFVRNGISVDTANYDRDTLLHLAALHGRDKVIALLLRLGASVNQLNNDGTTPLYNAVMHSHGQSALLISKAGGKFTVQNVAGVLCDAAASGGEGLIRRLHQVGVDMDEGDYDRRTALHLSASTGRLKVVQVLISCGADVNVKDRFGGTPMMDALRNKHVGVAEYLFSQGGEFDQTFISNALCDASSRDDIDEVQRLVQFGADINSGDYDGRTALHLSASDGRQRVVQYLIEAGADVNVRDRFGGTPLQDAIKTKHFNIVTTLQNNGAEIGDEDLSGLLCATAYEGDVQQLQVLIESGANPNSGDYDQRTALHLAAAAGRYEAVAYLIEAGADVNVKDRWGGTPLADAVAHKHTELVALLNENGATMEQDQIAARLCDAASRGDADDVKRVIEAGADCNSGDYDGRTAMHLAASSGHQHVVQLLVNLGADVNAADRWGSTPLTDAMRGGFKAIEALLISAGAIPPRKKVERKQRLGVKARSNHGHMIGSIAEDGGSDSDGASVASGSLASGGGRPRHKLSSVSDHSSAIQSSMSSESVLPHRRVTIFANWAPNGAPVRVLLPPKGTGTLWEFFRMIDDRMAPGGGVSAAGPAGTGAEGGEEGDKGIARVFTKYGVEILELSAVVQDDVVIASRGEAFKYIPRLFVDPRRPWQSGNAPAVEAGFRMSRASMASLTSDYSDLSDDGSEVDNLWAPSSSSSPSPKPGGARGLRLGGPAGAPAGD